MQTIWITGASSGIGKALAIKFAKEGWKVAISARRENLLNEIAKIHSNIFSYPLDVTDSEKCKLVFNNIKEKFKSIDISFFKLLELFQVNKCFNFRLQYYSFFKYHT